MNCNSKVNLSARERATVTAILAEAGSRIGTVKVFGSRARGSARPSSDLDLVIFPPAPAQELNRLRQAFDDSDLPITVDVLAWEDIAHQPLREEISRHSIPLLL